MIIIEIIIHVAFKQTYIIFTKLKNVKRLANLGKKIVHFIYTCIDSINVHHDLKITVALLQ